MQDSLKERIRTWLKEQRQTREWLAEKCGVEKRTVDNWLSSPRAIPQKALLIIEGLIGESTDQEFVAAPDSMLVVRVSEEQFDAYNRASMAEGKTIMQWMLDLLDDAAQEDDSSCALEEDPILKMAEETLRRRQLMRKTQPATDE